MFAGEKYVIDNSPLPPPPFWTDSLFCGKEKTLFSKLLSDTPIMSMSRDLIMKCVLLGHRRRLLLVILSLAICLYPSGQ